jgi:hypothetical protein
VREHWRVIAIGILGWSCIALFGWDVHDSLKK